MTKYVVIDGVKVGKGYAPYIVAELSANHGGSLTSALKSIELAKEAGANAIKLQTYTPDSMTLDCQKDEFLIKEGLWQGTTLYNLYQQAHTPKSWHKALFNKAKEVGISIFSTPFDESAVDFLMELDVPVFKVASFEITDLPLISYIAQTGKPIIMSTGMASLIEIEQAVNTAKNSGCENLILLHCISSYPAPVSQCNLNTIFDLANRFDVPVGLSDHTLGTAVSVAAVALGACFIEKHFMNDSSQQGPDSSFSITPDELEKLCQESKVAWQAIGGIKYGQVASEKTNLKFRRSIYFTKDMKKNDVITNHNIRRIRPGYGLAPKHFNDLIGKKVIKDIGSGTAVSWELIAE